MSEHVLNKPLLVPKTSVEKLETALLNARAYRSSLSVQKTLLATLVREVNQNLKRVTTLIETLESK